MTAPDWITIEDAIATWVALGGAAVAWAEDDGPRPAKPFVSMHVDGIARIGQDWTDIQDAAAPVAGAEIEHLVRGTRSLTLTLQCFASSPTGTLAAVGILEKIITAARLPTARAALNDAKLGVSAIGPVRSIGKVINSADFEPRAVVEVTLFTVAEQVETSTYIETVETEGTVE